MQFTARMSLLFVKVPFFEIMVLVLAVLLLLGGAEGYLQLSSAVVGSMLSSLSQHFEFHSSGDQLYAAPNLSSYSVLLWLQLQSLSSVSNPVLSLAAEGKQVFSVSVTSDLVTGAFCNICETCESISLAGPQQPFQWFHVEVSVSSLAATITVTFWKTTTTHAFIQFNNSLSPYSAKNSMLTVGGFLVRTI